MRTTQQAPVIARAAEIPPDAVNRDARTIDVVWTTGATVQRAQWDGWNEIVEYDEELIVSDNAVRLDRLNAGGPFLDSHRGYSLDSVLGSVVPGSVRIEGGRGTATIQLTEAADAADRVARILDKTIRFVSVGYRVHEYEVQVRDGQRQLWRAVDWEPYEISAVPMPADAGAHIRGEQPQVRAFPCIVTRDDAPAAPAALGAEENTMPEDENAGGVQTDPNTPAQQPVPDPAPTAPPDNGTDAQRAVATERQRTSGIMDLCQRHGLADQAGDFIARGLTMDAVRSELLDSLAARSDGYGRRQEPAPAAARGAGGGMQFRDAAAAALMHSANPRRDLPDAAREFRNMTPMGVARECLRRAGVETRNMSAFQVVEAALNTRAGVGYHTTSDFGGILAAIANMSVRDAYEAQPRTFTTWARRISLPDFRPATVINMTGMSDLQKVPEAGEFKYGTLGSGAETIKLETYGLVIAFTRQLLVNDHLGMLTAGVSGFGAKAAKLEADLVYGVLTGNPVLSDGVALFHATHGNLGTAATITDASLAAAMLAFATRKAPNGDPISVTPRYLIVPPGPREMEARRVMAQVTPGNSSEVNVYAGALQIIVEPRLIPASGQHPWFLAADPSFVDTISYAYLDGQDGVYTDSRTGFEVDGVENKVRLDFGTAPMDFRGLYKNPGAAPA